MLLAHSTARVEVVDGVPPEYLAGSRKIVGDTQFPVLQEQVRAVPTDSAHAIMVSQPQAVTDVILTAVNAVS